MTLVLTHRPQDVTETQAPVAITPQLKPFSSLTGPRARLRGLANDNQTWQRPRDLFALSLSLDPLIGIGFSNTSTITYVRLRISIRCIPTPLPPVLCSIISYV